MRMGSIRVVVVFSSFLLFFSGGPGGLSPPEGRFPPPAPDIVPSPWTKKEIKHDVKSSSLRQQMENSFI